jgi:DNA-binding transcriptional MerR regulator
MIRRLFAFYPDGRCAAMGMMISDFNTVSAIEFNFFRTSEVAKKTGLSPDAINRIYKQFSRFIGVLKETSDADRLWSEEQVELLTRINHMNRAEGFGFAKIKMVLGNEKTSCALTSIAQDKAVVHVITRIKEENGLMREAMRRLGEIAKSEIDHLKQENGELKHAMNMLMFKLDEMHSHDLEGRYHLQGVVSEKMKEFSDSLNRLEGKIAEKKAREDKEKDKGWFGRFCELLSA